MASVTGSTATSLTIRQAAFIGVGAMVGAGIFALLGAAGEVAGAAVWVSFMIAGIVAGLQGYSFAKLGSRFPSAGGILEYVARGYGDGHVTGVSRGCSLRPTPSSPGWWRCRSGATPARPSPTGARTGSTVFAVLVVAVMTLVNILGSQAVARAQTVVVYVVVGILTLFAVSTLANIDLDLLAFSGYPSLSDIVASVALTFFAFLGFGVVTFTAKDLADPSRQLSRAIYLALGIATDDLHRGGARRLRHVDGRRGDRLRGDRSGCRRRTHPRPGRLLADDGHGALCHLRRDELGAVPCAGPL